MRSLDPHAVYLRALDPHGSKLDEVELLVYAIKELETYIAMSGWENFFMEPFYLYREVRRCLELSGDTRSLAILDDFVACVSAGGFAFDEDGIAAWSKAENEKRDAAWLGVGAPAALHLDWGAQFEAAESERWQRIKEYLRSRDIILVDAETRWGPS